MSPLSLPLTLLLALAACTGSGSGRGGAPSGESAADTARRQPHERDVADTGSGTRSESLRFKPPERRPPPPRLDRPLTVPPADSGATKQHDTAGKGE